MEMSTRMGFLGMLLIAAIAFLPTSASATASQRSVYYTYDVLGRQTAARFDSASGADKTTNLIYDPLGRLHQTDQGTGIPGTDRIPGTRYLIRRLALPRA